MMASTRDGHCAACLLEAALAADAADSTPSLEAMEAATPQLIIHVPLGASRSASVFLARHEGTSRLLRLKTWHTTAPSDFLRRFQDLQLRLASLNEGAINRPLAASVSGAGCPSVLSEFRPGTPLLERVKQGRIDPDSAVAGLEVLIEATRRAHAVDLVHGSVVPGNVIFDPGSGTSFLLDFGLNSLVSKAGRDSAHASVDDAGFALLTRMLRELAPSAARSPHL